MPRTEGQKISKKKYEASNVRRYVLAVYKNSDADRDIFEKLESVPAYNTYLKDLIRADIEG